MTIQTDHDLLLAIHQNTIDLGNRVASIETRTKEIRDQVNIVEYNSKILSEKFAHVDERQRLYEQLFDEFRINHDLKDSNLDKKIIEVAENAVNNKMIKYWNKFLKTIIYIIIAILISFMVSFSKGKYPVLENILKGVTTTL